MAASLVACLAAGAALPIVAAAPARAEVQVGTPDAVSWTPAQVVEIVVEEAVNLRVPVSLALAVAHAESNFNTLAVSSAGARGVMQIMPATALGEYAIEADLLWEPRVNIRLGLHFLRRLLDRYQGRVDLALSYYNGGSRVGDLPNARVIPATRPYVVRVRQLERDYRLRLLRGEVVAWRDSPPRN